MRASVPLVADLDDHHKCMLRFRAGASPAAVSARREQLARPRTNPHLKPRTSFRAWEQSWLERNERAAPSSERLHRLDRTCSNDTYQLAQHLAATQHLAYNTFQRSNPPLHARSPPPRPQAAPPSVSSAPPMMVTATRTHDMATADLGAGLRYKAAGGGRESMNGSASASASGGAGGARHGSASTCTCCGCVETTNHAQRWTIGPSGDSSGAIGGCGASGSGASGGGASDGGRTGARCGRGERRARPGSAASRAGGPCSRPGSASQRPGSAGGAPPGAARSPSSTAGQGAKPARDGRGRGPVPGRGRGRAGLSVPHSSEEAVVDGARTPPPRAPHSTESTQ